VRKALLALTLLFLISHAACLPTTFADLDAINFALGVRDFDVAAHQPHPPGYPVFIAAAKASTAALGAAGVPAPEVRGLAILSAISGALLIPLLFWLARALLNDEMAAGWAAVITALSPLFWFNAVRPLSDLTGLAIVVCAQALLVSVVLRRGAPHAGTRLVAGALIAGVAIGVRSQNFVLTLPLLALALVMPGTGLAARERLGSVLALGFGSLAWFVPLLLASGGLGAYLEALRNQATEDFSGVVMLWTTRTARVAIDAVEYSFIWPWGTPVAGWIVVAIAAAGAVRMLRRRPLALAIVAVAFVPYAVFHLLFQETLTTRYALPLVVPVGVCVACALAGAGRLALHGGGTVLVAWSLAVAAPAAIEYASEATPASSAVRDALAADPRHPIGMHAVMLRTEHWHHDNASGRMIRKRHGDEVNALVEHWRGDPRATILFIVDPRRSDLARLDPRARSLEREYGWGFDEFPLLGGVRPGPVQLFKLSPPGWMLDDGWAITAEIGGQTERAGAGPHRRPSVAWVRSGGGAATMMIGGRNLGAAGGDDALITIRAGEQVIATFPAAPGFFFHQWSLPSGTFANADPWMLLTVTGAPGIPVGLEQFDLQPDGVPMFGYADGWQEPEYQPTEGRTWRWMSERARLWIRPVGRDVTLEVKGESPLQYFDSAPTVRVSVGGQTLAEFSPTDDFSQAVRIPAALLADNDEVVIESNRSFVPRGGDQRNLALRIYAVTVN
jgi:hypothetical protein